MGPLLLGDVGQAGAVWFYAILVGGVPLVAFVALGIDWWVRRRRRESRAR